MDEIRSRIGHWRDLLAPAWHILFAVPFAVLAAAAFARDEFLSPETAAKLKMPVWLPGWSWQTWVAVTLFAVLCLVLEGSYRLARRRPSMDPATQALLAHTEELRLQREAREQENDPIRQALAAAFSQTRSTNQIDKDDNPADHRIPILYFLQEAEKAGWDISGKTNLHIIDLLDSLRQAGLDGAVTLFGRRNRHVFKALTVREPLLEIARNHWEDYEISSQTIISREDNFESSTCKLGAENIYEGSFVDLHLDGLAGTLWLQGPAEGFKGRRGRLKGQGL